MLSAGSEFFVFRTEPNQYLESGRRFAPEEFSTLHP